MKTELSSMVDYEDGHKYGLNPPKAINDGADVLCHRAGVSSTSSTSFEKRRPSHEHVEHEHGGIVEAELEHGLEKSCNRTGRGALKSHNPAPQIELMFPHFYEVLSMPGRSLHWDVERKQNIRGQSSGPNRTSGDHGLKQLLLLHQQIVHKKNMSCCSRVALPSTA